jgi:uncharacterized damage-inducible protein DinB
MNVDDHRRWFRYDAWANRETLRSIKAAASPPQRSVRLMAHIVAAEHLWHGRLLQQKPTMPVWPEFDLARSEAELERLPAIWTDYLGALSEERLRSEVTYTNSKGESFSTSSGDILSHVVMHGAYHRAQIAADLRANGFEPAYTDFIHAVRQKHI